MGLTAVYRAVLGRVPHRKNNRQLRSPSSSAGSGDDRAPSASRGTSSSQGSSSQMGPGQALATVPPATSLVGLLNALLQTVQTGRCQQSDLPIHFNESLGAAKRISTEQETRKMKRRKLALKRLAALDEDDDEDGDDDDDCAAAPGSAVAIQDMPGDRSEEGDDEEDDDEEEAEDAEVGEDQPVSHTSKKPAAMPAPKLESDPIAALLGANPKVLAKAAAAAPKYEAKSKKKVVKGKPACAAASSATQEKGKRKDSCKGGKGKQWEEIIGKNGNKAIDHDKETLFRTTQESGCVGRGMLDKSLDT